MSVLDMVRSVISRCKVDRPGVKPQLTSFGGARVTPEVDVMQPQGLHFVAPSDAQGVQAAPAGDMSNVVALGLGGAVPTPAPSAGEGGLHYLASWKVYLASDGSLHLGEKDPDGLVPEASKIQVDLDALTTAFNAHVHPTAALGPPSPPTAVPSVIPVVMSDDISTTVRIGKP